MNTVSRSAIFSKKFDAEQKFEHFTSEPSAQDKYTLLMKRLGQNYFAYRESLMSKDKESLIEKAAEITAMQEAYSYLTTKFEFGDEMLDDVLALENPLKYFADRWLLPVSDVFDVDMDIREILPESETARNTCVREDRLFLSWHGCKCGSGSSGMSGCGEAVRDLVHANGPETILRWEVYRCLMYLYQRI